MDGTGHGQRLGAPPLPRMRHVVLHTAEFTDEELLATVRADPSTCLYVQPGQANITLIARSPGCEST